MSRFGFRASSSFARALKRKLPVVERLESRCVLSGNAFFAPPPSALQHFQFDHGGLAGSSVASPIRFNDARIPTLNGDRIDQNTFGRPEAMGEGYGANRYSAFGMPASSNSFDVGPPQFVLTEFVAAPPPMYSVSFVAVQYEIVFIHSSALPDVPNNYVPVSAPAEMGAVSPHLEVPPPGASKPGIAPAYDPAPQHSSQASNGAGSVHAQFADAVPPGLTNSSGNPVVHVPLAAQSVPANVQGNLAGVRSLQLRQDRLIVPAMQGSGASQLIAAAPTAKSATEPASDGAKQSVGENSSNVIAAGAAATSSQAVSAEIPGDHPVMAGASLDLVGVEQALKTVMSRLAIMGAELNSWLDDAQFAPMIAAVAGAALGAGGACYLRRRAAASAGEHDEEASSSWLFERMQPVHGER